LERVAIRGSARRQARLYVVTKVDLPANKSSSNLWLASADGKTRRQLTTTPRGRPPPALEPDGNRVLFQSNRSGSLQLW